ncbi:carbohydrate ABC transporter permease [Natronococcus occultus]|uniref:Carbohydrate ABC transporter membrane protein 1, CUT1 family n=1 Tax=Natronococcus occultus SP4 TaxID=694430 RepID=L0JXR1_9EURY|nr:sugar ABC transporter permease [Natronococcus occultus]AGB37095.1 carbohydrate ABC transporter membrane protein 1, CUT1 family [Natronococcus occultus SP4]
MSHEQKAAKSETSSREPLLNRLDISKDLLKWVFLLPSVALLAFLTLYPFLQGIWMSAHDWPFAAPDHNWVGVSQYVEILSSDRFQNSLWRTVIFTGGGVTFQLVLGIALAVYLKSLTETWRPIVRTIFIIPMVMTPVATGLVWRMMLDGQVGILNVMIESLGFSAPAWTSSSGMAMFTILMIDTWQWTPLVVLIVFAGLLSVPQQLYEAARVDGAPSWAIFWHITLPQIKYFVAIAAVFRLMESFRTFDYIWLVTEGGPGTATEILNVFVYRLAFVNLDGGAAATVGIILLVITIAVTMSLFKVVDIQ